MTKRLFFVAVVLIFMLGASLAACGASAPVPQPAAATGEPSTGSVPTEVPVAVPTEAAQSVPTEALLPTATETSAVSGTVSFSADVLPILQANCTRCHGGSGQSGGLALSSFDNLMTGSRNGPVIVAGDAPNSVLVQLIQAGRMPRQSARLADEQIQTIVDWVNAGAPNN